MELTIKITKHYGNTIVYPICDKSKIFAEIAKTKTLTPDTLDLLKDLGYSFIVEAAELPTYR